VSQPIPREFLVNEATAGNDAGGGLVGDRRMFERSARGAANRGAFVVTWRGSDLYPENFGSFVASFDSNGFWDRRDDAGRRVPRGVYFVSLDTGPRRRAARLALVHE
jgi:hypothetical protein